MFAQCQKPRDDIRSDSTEFDAIIVGGGVYGIMLGLEAAKRGIRPVLLEKDEFGRATSDNSLRIIHGGLRYLQSLDVARYRTSRREQQWFLENLTELVHPLGCIMPIYNRGSRRTSVFRVALGVDNLLARRVTKNPAHPLPPSRVISRQETIDLFPVVDKNGLRGAAFWHDVVMPDPRRVVAECVARAQGYGCVCVEHTEATQLVVESNQVTGVEVLEQVSGDRFRVRAPIVINAAGPWCRDVVIRFDRDIPHLFHPSMAFNLLLNREPLSPHGVAVSPNQKGASAYFLLPSEGKVMAGTYHVACDTTASPPAPTPSQIQDLLNDLNLAIPGMRLAMEDVTKVLAGYLPAKSSGSRSQATDHIIHDHGRSLQGLYSVSGVKYTTARAVAEETLQQIGIGTRSTPVFRAE